MSVNMKSHDWFSAGKNKTCCRFLFPLGLPPQWALFQAGFVFQNIEYRLFLLSSNESLSLCAPACSGCSPELATAGTLVSNQRVTLWSGRISAPSLLFFFCFLFALISFPHSDQSAAVGSPRGWEIPAANSHCITINWNTPKLCSDHREN